MTPAQPPASCVLSQQPSLLDGLSPEEQQKLSTVLDEYLRALESGVPPAVEALQAAHPELADVLAVYLDNLRGLHDVAATFGHPGGSQPAALLDNVEPEKRLGDFVLDREIGRGGMGVVYEARQLSLARRVALKVLPFAAVLEAQQIARFKNEAQATAQLHHPHIVPVFAIGVERGVHYYAMQLIDGQPLDRVIDALQATRGDAPSGEEATPAPAPASLMALVQEWNSCRSEFYRSVIRLGIQAAGALHAAHSLGIVHRDIKPSNLLFDVDGKLWITDFGLARCQTDRALTKTGDVVGTRQYMSPEQASGQAALVDQRTDVYSLGATLYELLTLQPAFAPDSATAPPRDWTSEPLALRRYDPRIPGDLETVLLKALAPQRDERYLTAEDFADDLRRVLLGQPTVARPPSLVDRWNKWGRRHQRALATTAGLSLLLATGLLAGTIWINRERTKAERNFVRAEQYFRQAQETVDLFGSRMAERLADVPGADSVRRELLEVTRGYYEQFVAAAGDDPNLRAELALTQSKLGTVHDRLGASDAAIAAHRVACELLAHLAEQHPQVAEHRQQLGISRNNLALSLARAGKTEEALATLDQALVAQRSLLSQATDSRAYQADVALTLNNRGHVQREVGLDELAETSFRQALTAQQSLATDAPTSESLRKLAATCNNLAGLIEVRQPEQALTLYQRASRELRAAGREADDPQLRAELALTQNNLGAAFARSGKLAEAIPCYAEAIALQAELLRAAPHERTFRRDLAVSYNNLGLAHSRLHQPTEAQSCFQNALELQQRLIAEQPRDAELQSSLGGVCNNLGIVHEEQSRWQEAADSYARAVAHQNKAHEQAPTVERYRTFLSKHYYNYGRVLRQLGRSAEAAKMALARKELWPGDGERLLSVAEELALASQGLPRNQASTPTSDECADWAVATLGEALSADTPLPKDWSHRAALANLKIIPVLFGYNNNSFGSPLGAYEQGTHDATRITRSRNTRPRVEPAATATRL